MSRFSIDHKRDKKKSIGGFHADYIDSGSGGRKKKKSMGIGRSIGSAFSLILGGTMCYVSLHYIPAFANPKTIIAVSDSNQSATRLDSERSGFLLGAYLDAFSVKRTYLRNGQSIQAQYALPDGMDIELSIKRCNPVFVLEVFQCDVVGEKTILITNDKTGTQRFIFQGKGFYMFDERIIKQKAQDDYRVVWSRV